MFYFLPIYPFVTAKMTTIPHWNSTPHQSWDNLHYTSSSKRKPCASDCQISHKAGFIWLLFSATKRSDGSPDNFEIIFVTGADYVRRWPLKHCDCLIHLAVCSREFNQSVLLNWDPHSPGGQRQRHIIARSVPVKFRPESLFLATADLLLSLFQMMKRFYSCQFSQQTKTDTHGSYYSPSITFIIRLSFPQQPLVFAVYSLKSTFLVTLFCL